jgi:hypothetical protein
MINSYVNAPVVAFRKDAVEVLSDVVLAGVLAYRPVLRTFGIDSVWADNSGVRKSPGEE